MNVWPVIATAGSRPEWLAKQMDALLPQLGEADGLVLVYDGAGKPDADWLDDERVQCVRLADNVGVDTARRLGNALVPTDAVVIEIDDHDIAEPGLIDAVRAAFAEPRIMVAYCDVYHSTADGQVRKLKEKNEPPIAERGNLGWGMRAYRQWAYDCVGGYPKHRYPANDFELLCRLEQFGGGVGCVAHIRQPLVTVIEDGQGISRRLKDEQQNAVEAIVSTALNGAGFRLPYELRAPMPQVTRHEVAGVPPVPADIANRKRGIPKLIHFVWVGPPMPDWVRENIERFKALNPEYRTLVHGEEQLLERLRPGYDAIHGEHEWARKSDLIRVSVLRKFGGWYFDTDFVPFRPVDDIVADYDGIPEGCFLTWASSVLVANGIIGTSINSPFFQIVFEEIAQRASTGEAFGWGGYGPQLYTKLVQANQDKVRMGRNQAFFPIVNAEQSQRDYLDLKRRDFAPEAIEEKWGWSPYTLHMHMHDRLVVGEEYGIADTAQPENQPEVKHAEA